MRCVWERRGNELRAPACVLPGGGRVRWLRARGMAEASKACPLARLHLRGGPGRVIRGYLAHHVTLPVSHVPAGPDSLECSVPLKR